MFTKRAKYQKTRKKPENINKTKEKGVLKSDKFPEVRTILLRNKNENALHISKEYGVEGQIFFQSQK